MMKPLRVSLIAALLVGACSPTDVDEPFGIRPDSAAYHLRQEPGAYRVDLEVTVTNPLDRTVFLHRQCGYGDNPSRTLLRVGGDTTSIWLDGGVCITQPPRDPIPLRAGETYVDHVHLVSTESPHARPPITMEMRTGTFVLVYDIQLTDAVEGWSAVDPLPVDLTTSTPFIVRAPE